MRPGGAAGAGRSRRAGGPARHRTREPLRRRGCRGRTGCPAAASRSAARASVSTPFGDAPGVSPGPVESLVVTELPLVVSVILPHRSGPVSVQRSRVRDRYRICTRSERAGSAVRRELGWKAFSDERGQGARMGHVLGIAMNGVTGRMGYRQHLVRSILAIREAGGVALPDGSPGAGRTRAGRAQRGEAARVRRASRGGALEHRSRRGARRPVDLDLLRLPGDQRPRGRGEARHRGGQAHLRREAGGRARSRCRWSSPRWRTPRACGPAWCRTSCSCPG